MKKYAVEIKWAIIFIIAAFVWMFIGKITGLHDVHIDKHAKVTLIFAIPVFVIYFLALKEKRETVFEGKMTWLQGFITGMIITAIVAVVSPLSQYVTHTFITPDYFTNAINYGVEMGKGTEEELSAMLNLESYVKTAPFMTIAMGAVTSAIMAIFTKS